MRAGQVKPKRYGPLALLCLSILGACVPAITGERPRTATGARVTFLSDPPGARVLLNRVELAGVTPILHVAVEPGFADVEFALDGYRSRREQRTFEPGAALRLDVRLEPLPEPSAMATPTSTPTGTALPTSTATIAAELPVGADVEPTPTREPSPTPAAEPQPATVSFASEPPGAEVRVDGRLLGRSLLEEATLPAGDALIRFDLDGHESVEIGRTWKPGEVDRVEVVLFALATEEEVAAPTPVPSPDARDFAHVTAAITALGDARFGEDNPLRNHVGDEMWIGRTEVTVAAYGECVAAGRCEPAGKGPDCNSGVAGRLNHPVNCVRAVDAQTYAGWLGETSGVPYGLPTCDEWEHAARLAGRFPWGGDEPGSRCNSCDRQCAFTNFRNESVDDGARTTAPVGSMPECRSPQGVFDQVGNVAEWCGDGRAFQVRGGSWGQVGVFLEPAFAVRRAGDDRDPTVGFRVIVAAPASP